MNSTVIIAQIKWVNEFAIRLNLIDFGGALDGISMLIIALLLQTEAHKHQHAYAHMCEQNGIASALSECSS